MILSLRGSFSPKGLVGRLSAWRLTRIQFVRPVSMNFSSPGDMLDLCFPFDSDEKEVEEEGDLRSSMLVLTAFQASVIFQSLAKSDCFA